MRVSIFFTLTVFCVLAITKTAFSDNRYWVNGSGNWNDSQQWSETSGGAPGASVPGKEDHVIFDHNSFTSNSQTVIIKDKVYCNDFRWEVDNYQPKLKSSAFIFKKLTKAEIEIYGSLIIKEHINNAFFGDIILKSSKESNIEVNSNLMADIIIDAVNGEYKLKNDLETKGNIYLKSGAFNSKDNKITAKSFVATGNNERTMNLGNSEIEINEWNFAESENLTFNVENAKLLFKKDLSKKYFKPGGLSYNDFSKANEKSSFTYNITSTDVTCNGAENGMITAIVTSGGTSPFTYTLFDDGLNLLESSTPIASNSYTFQPNPPAAGVSGGSYLVKIEDDDETIRGEYTTIDEPLPLNADSISVITPLSCFNSSDAELEAFASGGKEPYSYNWTKFNTLNSTFEPIGQTTKIATNISQGIYRVYINDDNSCGPVYVNKYFTNPPDDENIPDEIIFDNISHTNSCEGADDGTITLEASGGNGNIDYYLIRLSDMQVIPAGPPYDEDGYFTGLQPDNYETYAIDENGCTKQGSDVEIEETTNPTADAGTAGDECDFNFDLNANPSVGIGTWTSSGPGNAGFSPNANDPNATVTVDAYGSYDFTWTEDNDGCIDQDQVTVNFYENPTADAGTGGDECDLDFTLNASPSIGNGTWTYTGPGTVNFAPDANDPNATVTVNTYGSYDFTWTEDNNGCTDADQITVNFYEQPTADAGSGGSVCAFAFGLNATIDLGTGTWTYSGPGNASFAPDANDPNATATVDAYGTYTFTWTEVNGSCSDDDNVVVNYLETPVADAGTGGNECDFDFVLNANPSLGTGTWTFAGPGTASFIPDANNPNATVTVDAYGTYTFTWTEVNGLCSDDDDVVVNFYEQPTADAGTDGDECDLDFVLNATPSLGTGTWTYAGPGNATFTPNANDPNATATVDAYGTYTFTWTEVNGSCSDDDDVIVNFYEQPTADAGTGGDECALDFVLNANPSAGIGTWTYTGPGNATFTPNANDPAANASVDAYGTYTFTWTEVNGSCSDNDNVVVNFYEQPTADAGTGGDECDDNFVLNATASVGTGTWTQTSGPGASTFTPNANDPNATVEVTAYGSYEFTWTEDNNGCIDADQITVNFYEQPIADAGLGGSACGLDFGLSANPSAGTGTWTFTGPGNAAFNPNANDPNATATVDAYGTYTFTWTEVNVSCSDDDNVVVEYIESPYAYAGIDTLLCYNTDYTILDADTTNCAGLSWSTEGDGTFDDNNNLNPTYSPGQGDLTNGYADLILTATGNLPCADATDTLRINYLPQLRASIGKPAPFFIDSSSTHIDVYVKMSNHEWLAHVGVYLISPNDSVVELKQECEVIFPITFEDNATWKFYNDPEDSTSLAPVSACNPTSTGRFLFYGNWKGLHGQDPANGAWRIKIIDYENSGPPGLLEEATLKFSDYNNEGILESVLYADSSINKPIKRFSGVSGPGITSHALSITGLTTSCFGICDATAVGTPSGGQPPYISYEWSDNADFSNIIATTDTIDLCAGTFYLRIIDSHGCTAIDSITVGEPPEILITSDTVVHNLCYGDSLGKIALAFSGGTGALQYTINGTDWYNSGDTIENLGSGDYLITIKDAAGCVKDTLTTINQPAPINITTNVTNISCYDSDDGIIEILASGGTPGTITPYLYSVDSASIWNPGNIFSPLSPDTFYVAVQDSLGCIQFGDTVIISNPDTIVIDSVDIAHVACDGSAINGEIVVYATGGTGNIEYSINNGADYYPDSLFAGLDEGDYQIAVRDENGCTKLLDTLVTINGPIVITSDTVVHNQCYGDSIGRIALAFTGGTGALKYTINGTDWYNSGDTIENLGANSYVVIIEDATGCAKDTLITINQPDPINIVASYNDITCNGYTDGEIEITATEGTSPYEYSIDSGQTWHSSNVFSGLPTDTFYLAVQDDNGCIQFGDTIIIKEAEPLIISVIDTIAEYQCINSSKRGVNETGLIKVEVSGGKGDYQYNWQIGSTTISGNETIRNLSAGTYELTVEDSLGCQKDTTISISSDTSYDIEFTVTIEDTIICWYQPIHFTFNSINADYIEIQKYRPVSSYEYIEVTDETIEYDYYNITANNYFNLKAYNDYCEDNFITGEFKYYSDRELTIIENDEIENDTIIIKGENGQWEAMASVNNNNGLIVSWTPTEGVANPDSLFTRISPSESIWYNVQITTQEGGCTDSDSIYIEYVPDIFTYEGFSPNGDGINDFWYIENINTFKNNVVSVYNRWGTKVYEQKGYNNEDSSKRWDGTAKNGKALGSGTYYYVIILNEEGFSPLTGAITIMR